MSGYTKANLRDDVEDQAPNFGMSDDIEARFARTAVGGKTLGLSLFTLDANFRIPFGHKHETQEEVYVVVRSCSRTRPAIRPVSASPARSATRRSCS